MCQVGKLTGMDRRNRNESYIEWYDIAVQVNGEVFGCDFHVKLYASGPICRD